MKACNNCKHYEVDQHVEPCFSCSHCSNNSDRDNWIHIELDYDSLCNSSEVLKLYKSSGNLKTLEELIDLAIEQAFKRGQDSINL
jgi:hypothetical protein